MQLYSNNNYNINKITHTAIQNKDSKARIINIVKFIASHN